MSDIVELQKRWIKIRSANIYDTLDKMGYPNQCISLAIKPIVPGTRIAGCAVTMRGMRAPYTEEEIESNKAELDPPFEQIQSYAYPGCVIVIDGGGEPMTGKCGEMTSWAFKQKGATGIVVDGYIRDYEGLLDIRIGNLKMLSLLSDPCLIYREGHLAVEGSIHHGGILIDAPLHVQRADERGLRLLIIKRHVEVTLLSHIDGGTDEEEVHVLSLSFRVVCP